ncbi:MAG: cystathionine beta-lyase [Pseudomonadota bacterium]
MAKDSDPKALSTRLVMPTHSDGAGFRSLAVPTYRASTTLFDDLDNFDHPRPGQYRYGLQGTPTHHALMAKLAAIEGAEHVQLAPSGLAAIALVLLTFAKAGGHMLLPASAYGPTLDLARYKLAALGVECTIYDPMIGGGIADLIRDETVLIWCESPGSITMEVQDVPAIAAAAHARGVPVAIDNTYGAGVLFDAFAAGCDVSIQALTKYQGGHSDVLMGSVATRDAAIAEKIDRTFNLLGLNVSPDDCSLVLRGLKTFPLRLERIGASAIQVASWLSEQDAVTAMLHPAFSDCPGHDIWKRDWSGSAGLFSVLFGNWSREQVVRFVEALKLFPIGYSWGGANSLAVTYHNLDRPDSRSGPLLVRINIGLEDPADLIADLRQAIAAAS